MVVPRESLPFDDFAPEPLVEDAERLGAPATDGTRATVAALRPAIVVAASGGTPKPVVVVHEPWIDELLAAYGTKAERQLLQMRGPLPVVDEAPVVVRPFRPGTVDETDWLAVNNRAFWWHPEQSDLTIDDLHAKMGEPWFDPDGFLLHHVGASLAGFCWTKVHPSTASEPCLGEIFVIGVDPAFHGRGLGRALTAAGFGWLARHGAEVGMLYVEHDNLPAVHVYRTLGLTEHERTLWLAPAVEPVEPAESAGPRGGRP